MKRTKHSFCRRGFTLVELVTVIALSGVLTMVVGALLVSSHRHWNALYHRVYRAEAIDSFSAHTVFDRICRQSSFRKASLGSDHQSLEVYYWNSGSTSETPDRYARFYLSGDELMVEEGVLTADGWTPDLDRPTQRYRAASHVERVRFDVQGPSVSMIVHYADSGLKPLICSAVRQNF